MSAGVNFNAQVDDWVRETQQRLNAVFRESVQRVVTLMQTPVADGGNMPVDTGFLRASLQLSRDAPVAISTDRPSDSATYTYSPTVASLAIAGAQAGDVLYGTYTANYARHVHYGTSTINGRQWVTLAAQHWPAIVAQVVADLKSRASGGGGA